MESYTSYRLAGDGPGEFVQLDELHSIATIMATNISKGGLGAMDSLLAFVRSLVRMVEDSDIEFLDYRTWWGGVTVRKRRRPPQ